MTKFYMLDEDKNRIEAGRKYAYDEIQDASLIAILDRITTVTLILSGSNRFLYVTTNQYDSSSEHNVYKWADSDNQYYISMTHNLVDDTLYTMAASGNNPITFDYAILSFM